jgi:hypothetical protein
MWHLNLRKKRRTFRSSCAMTRCEHAPTRIHHNQSIRVGCNALHLQGESRSICSHCCHAARRPHIHTYIVAPCVVHITRHILLLRTHRRSRVPVTATKIYIYPSDTDVYSRKVEHRGNDTRIYSFSVNLWGRSHVGNVRTGGDNIKNYSKFGVNLRTRKLERGKIQTWSFVNEVVNMASWVTISFNSLKPSGNYMFHLL